MKKPEKLRAPKTIFTRGRAYKPRESEPTPASTVAPPAFSKMQHGYVEKESKYLDHPGVVGSDLGPGQKGVQQGGEHSSESGRFLEASIPERLARSDVEHKKWASHGIGGTSAPNSSGRGGIGGVSLGLGGGGGGVGRYGGFQTPHSFRHAQLSEPRSSQGRNVLAAVDQDAYRSASIGLPPHQQHQQRHRTLSRRPGTGSGMEVESDPGVPMSVPTAKPLASAMGSIPSISSLSSRGFVPSEMGSMGSSISSMGMGMGMGIGERGGLESRMRAHDPRSVPSLNSGVNRRLQHNPYDKFEQYKLHLRAPLHQQHDDMRTRHITTRTGLGMDFAMPQRHNTSVNPNSLAFVRPNAQGQNYHSQRGVPAQRTEYHGLVRRDSLPGPAVGGGFSSSALMHSSASASASMSFPRASIPAPQARSSTLPSSSSTPSVSGSTLKGAPLGSPGTSSRSTKGAARKHMEINAMSGMTGAMSTPKQVEIESRDHQEMKQKKINMVLRAVEQKPFACPVCNMRFAKLDVLKEHILQGKHNAGSSSNPFSLRPFVCPLCSKSFDNKYNLKRHMMIHTGEKPYGCEICGKRFNQRSTYNHHKKRMH
ncbi:hypothetical protein AAMO2058_001617800 [Amorphochlora amoebiformis]